MVIARLRGCPIELALYQHYCQYRASTDAAHVAVTASCIFARARGCTQPMISSRSLADRPSGRRFRDCLPVSPKQVLRLIRTTDLIAAISSRKRLSDAVCCR